MEADIGLLERALDNLIDNALRYTQPGGSVHVTDHTNAAVTGLYSLDGRNWNRQRKRMKRRKYQLKDEKLTAPTT